MKPHTPPQPMNLTVLRVLWGALLSSTIVELGIVILSDFDRHVELQREIVAALACVAVTVGVVALVLPRRLYVGALTRLSLPLVEQPIAGNEGRGDYRRAAESQRVFQYPDAARAAMTRVFQTPVIVGLALAEGIAGFGVIVALGRLAPSWVALPFFAGAWGLLALQFPRASQVTAPAERVYGAKLLGSARDPQ